MKVAYTKHAGWDVSVLHANIVHITANKARSKSKLTKESDIVYTFIGTCTISVDKKNTVAPLTWSHARSGITSSKISLM